VPVLARLDDFLMNRVFQPTANAMAGAMTPAEAARFCVTGAMVFVLGRMLVAATEALPDWTVLLDFLALWAGMALLRALSMLPATRSNPLRDQFGLARPILAATAIAILLLGAPTLKASFGSMQVALLCMTLYFASCEPPARIRTKEGMKAPMRLL
jgi:hypothetical protein